MCHRTAFAYFEVLFLVSDNKKDIAKHLKDPSIKIKMISLEYHSHMDADKLFTVVQIYNSH